MHYSVGSTSNWGVSTAVIRMCAFVLLAASASQAAVPGFPCSNGSTSTLSWLVRGDGLIQELNASVAETSAWTRLIWGERGRFGPAFVEHYLHSSSDAGASAEWSGWLPDGSRVQANQSSIVRTCQALNETAFQVIAKSGFLLLTDTIVFHPELPRVRWELVARPLPVAPSGFSIQGAQFPVNLGSLVFGKAANGSFSSDSMFRVQADKGGTLQGSFTETGHTVSYPASIGTFSPVSIVGQWDSPGTTVAMAYTWDSLRLPNNVEFEEIPHNQFTTLLTQTVSVNFTADQEVIPIVIGIAGNSSWKSAMTPYLDWFQKAHPGPPSYCPSGPLMYFVGSNDMKGYNHTTHRYLPNSTLQGVFNTVNSAAAMKSVGIDRFGVWDTAFYSQYITKDGIPCEFNPDIELLDPNLDAAWNRSAVSAFTAAYSSAGIDVFHFARPCLEVVGARVEYGPAPGEYNVTAYGTCQVADLRNNSAQAQRQMQRLAGLVERGVSGFYLDAMSCPGDIAFLKQVRQRWPKLFLVKEGCRDIDALLWAQIPILKLPDYPVNNSLLLRYVTPQATVYGGAIDKNLNNSEFNHVLDEGYIGFVQNYPSTHTHPPSDQVCNYISRSYDNRLSLYNSYGKSHSCPQPPTSAPACV